MGKINFDSIKVRLITVSVLLLIVPLIVLGIFSFQNSRNSLEELGATNLKNSVEFTVKLIEALNAEVENGYLPLEEAQEQVKRAVLGEKNSEGMRPINKSLDLGENGYIFILDKNANQMAHPNIEGQNVWEVEDSNGLKFAQDMIATGNQGGGLTYYEWPLPNDANQVEQKVTYAKTDPYWGWTINASTYMMDFNKPAQAILKTIFIVISVSLLIGLVAIWPFANSISKPIMAITGRMNQLSSGDLSQEQIAITSKNEIGQLAEAMNQMQTKLRNIISDVSSASDRITSRSAELTHSANEVKAVSEQVAVTMEELAYGSETQANSSSELSFAMQTFATEVEEANDNGEQIQKISMEVLEITNEGNHLMNSSMEQMSIIDQIVQEAVQKVKGLDVQSQEISKLVIVIQEIAAQTNLLALNAAIEAARAGEHGKGFAVVADEVRKLAEQVSGSITEITDIVLNIRNESSMVTESLQVGYQEVVQGTSKIEETVQKFEGINSAVLKMVNSIEMVSNRLSSLATGSQQITSSIEGVAAISEESAAGIEQTSASSQQTSSAMEEVAVNSNDLAELAKNLNGLVRQFKL